MATGGRRYDLAMNSTQGWMRSRRETAPLLRTLSPRFEEDEHGYYANALFAQLVRVGPDAPRNIALTGHYGSGKSSVLVEVQARLNLHRRHLRRQRGKAVNVSLSSLGTDEPPPGRIGKDGAPPALTNLIQKEIVKQLLYRARPRRMRGSRFRRLDVFHPVPVALWTLVIAACLVATGLLFGLLDRVTQALPDAWTADGSGVPWATVGAITLAAAALGWNAARVLHNRVRIGDASAGPVNISLKDDTSSFFDAYLDELVYFFQASRTSVVIFEDLDRFDDPHIFESLRELNTVLSNAEQIRYRPVRFVYAIKDSIFETIADADDELPIELATPEPPAAPRGRSRPTPILVPAPEAAAPKSNADAVEVRREVTRNRTKFFDLVVPIVPFISHRNARELVRREFEDTGISEGLLDLIAPHLTDMRLLRNIRNEFDVFAAQILPPRGPEGLNRDQLLAMIVYKNLHLTDFEAIREGESILDDLYRLYRGAVTEATTAAELEAHAARTSLNVLDAGPTQVEDLGERLGAIADLIAAASSTQSRGVQVGSIEFKRDDLTDIVFWRTWAQTGTALAILNSYGSQIARLSPEDARTVLGVNLSADRWDEDQREALEHREREATARARATERASLEAVLADDTIRVPRDGRPTVPLRTIAEEMLDELTLALVVAGYLLDENYTLYVARFHVGKLSLRAMNFILHNIQPNRRDPRFKFNDPHNIDAIIKEEGQRFLAGDAIFNVEVFDHLLPERAADLRHALDRLLAESTLNDQFLDTYLSGGAQPEMLIKALAPRWPGVFTYLATEGRLAPEIAQRLSDVAARLAEPEIEYKTSPTAREAVRALTRHGSAFTDPAGHADPTILAALLSRFDLDVADLEPLAEPVRDEVVRQSRYVVTAENLRLAIRGEILQLDHLLEVDRVVYEHTRTHLQAYLDTVLEPTDLALTHRGPWRGVLLDLVHVRPEQVEQVLARSTPETRVGSLNEVEEPAWGVLARTGRFAATASNLARYIHAFSVDDDLRAFLTHGNDTVNADLDESGSAALALALINQAALPPVRLVPLVASLNVDGFAIGDLLPAAAPAVPGLTLAGLVPDERASYEFLVGQPWSVKRELIISSPAFAGYLPELMLEAAEVHELASDAEVPDPVKAALLDELVYVEDLIDPHAATEIARWAASRRRAVSVSDLVLLAEREANADAIFAALAVTAESLTWPEISQVLQAIGDPFDALLVTDDRRRLDLPGSEGLRTLLARLIVLRRVTSFEERGGVTFGVRRKINPPA